MQHPKGLCSMALGYNMCILICCSVSDSLVTVIGDQMTLRRPIFAPSLLTLQAVTVVFWKVNSVCNSHFRVQPCPADEYVLLWNNFSIWKGSHCRTAGSWMDISRIAAHVEHIVSVVCRCFQQWSMEYSHTLILGSGRPCSTYACQDQRIMLVAMAARTASREEIRAHVASAVSPRIVGNHLLAAGLRLRVPLTRLPLTPRHRQARLLWYRERVDWRVQWRSAVSSYFVCMRVMDVHVYGVDLMSVIFRSSFAHDRLHGVGGHPLQLAVTFNVSAE